MSQRRPTIREVAQRAGVSTVTVSRVNNSPELVIPATRARVEAALRELGYIPNLAARTMRTHATRTIGFLVPDLTSWTNAAVAQAAERQLAAAGYAMLLVSTDYRPEREILALAMLRTHQVDGIMLYVADQEDQDLRQAIAALDVPVVILDRALPGDADRVLSEHAPVIAEAVGHLAAHGHRRLGLVVPAMRIRPSLERREAFRAAAAAAGLDPADQRIVTVVPDADVDLEPLLDASTAIIVDGSRLLLAVLRAARAKGRAIPGDLSVVGIDAEDIALAARPEITRIVRDFGEIGRTAADLMLRRLGDRQRPLATVRLASRLILAASCAAAPLNRQRGGGE